MNRRRSEHADPGTANGSRGLGRATAATGTVAAVAVGSGLLLELTLAAALGANRISDAFFAAERVPLALAAVLMVVANQVLVPVITHWLVDQGKDRTWQLSTGLLLAAAVGGSLVAAALALLASPLMRLLAPGFGDVQHEVSVNLVRMLVLLIPMLAVSETLRSITNARGGHMTTAGMPMALSLPAAIIITVQMIQPGPTSVYGVAGAYLAGGSVQLVFMSFMARRRGFRLRRGALLDPEVKAALRLCSRPTAGASLNPLVRFVETAVASFLPAGTISIVHYGNRLISAVGGAVFFRSIMVTTIPRLTRAFARGNEVRARLITISALRMLIAVAFPLTAAVAVLGQPGVTAVFQVGRFDAESAALLGSVLAVYALSLPGSAIQRGLLAPFMATKNTKVVLRNTVYGALANIILLPLLVVPMRGTDTAVLGLAAAYTLAQYVNVAHAYYRLRRDFAMDLTPVRPVLVAWATVSALAGAAAAAVALRLDLYNETDRLLLLQGCLVAALAGGLVCSGLIVMLRRRLVAPTTTEAAPASDAPLLPAPPESDRPESDHPAAPTSSVLAKGGSR